MGDFGVIILILTKKSNRQETVPPKKSHPALLLHVDAFFARIKKKGKGNGEMDFKKAVRKSARQTFGIGIGSWVGTVLGWTLVNWRRGELSAAGFGWCALGCSIGCFLVAAIFFAWKLIAAVQKEKAVEEEE